MTSIKRLLKVVAAAALCCVVAGLAKEAMAAGNPDTLVVTVTPTGMTYGVTISSPFLAGYNFGAVNVGQTTVSTVAISVANSGTISAYFAVAVQDTTGGGNAWANNSASLNPGTTSYVMQGLFQAAQPAIASFSGATNNIPAAVPANGANTLGQGSNKTNPGASQNLWLRLGMPTGVAETGAHTLVLSVNAQAL